MKALLLLAACASTPSTLSNRGGTAAPAIDAPHRLACAWRFDWLGLVQLGGGECR